VGHFTYTFESGTGQPGSVARLLSIADDQGNVQSLSWGTGLTVSDSSSGRQLVFNGSGGYLSSVDAPGNPGTPRQYRSI
jgi:hypothetical protein